jgi:hypothetical protein
VVSGHTPQFPQASPRGVVILTAVMMAHAFIMSSIINGQAKKG